MGCPLAIPLLLVLLVLQGSLELVADDILQIPHERTTDYIHSTHLESFGYVIRLINEGSWQVDQNCFLLLLQLIALMAASLLRVKI